MSEIKSRDVGEMYGQFREQEKMNLGFMAIECVCVCAYRKTLI